MKLGKHIVSIILIEKKMKLKIFLSVFISLTLLCGSVLAAEEEVVARVGGESVLMSEVEEEAKGDLLKQKNKIYEIKKSALNYLIEKKLLSLEAKSQGIEMGELLVQIREESKPVTEEDVKGYYEANKSRIQGEYEKSKSRIRSYLERRSAKHSNRKAISDLKKKYKVEVLIRPPKIDIQDPENMISRGPEAAPVTIMVFTDFQCPYCKKEERVLSKVLKNYPEQVRFIHRDYPLSFHKDAKMAAFAARCANEQGKFWIYHDHLFANQGALDKESLIRYADDLGLEGESFKECLESNRYGFIIEKEVWEGSKYGVSGTPVVFVNGRPLQGAVSYNTLKEVIDEELKGYE